MKLKDFLNNNKKYKKLSKKIKNISSRNEKKLELIIFFHVFLSSFTTFLLLTPSSLPQYLVAFCVGLFLSFSTIKLHSNLLKNKYKYSAKTMFLFNVCNNKTEKIAKKNKEFFKIFNIRIDPNKVDIFIYTLKRVIDESSLEEIELNKEELNNLLNTLPQKSQLEINRILEKKALRNKVNKERLFRREKILERKLSIYK